MSRTNMKISGVQEGDEKKVAAPEAGNNLRRSIQVEVVRRPEAPAKTKSFAEHLRELLGVSESLGKIVVFVIVFLCLFWWREDIHRKLFYVESVEGLGVKLTFSPQAKTLLEKSASPTNTIYSIWYATSDEAKQAIARAQAEGRVYREAWILWVDDNPSNNTELIAFFESLGAHVITALSTEKAVDASKQLARIDLIISDIGRDKIVRDGKIEAADSGLETLTALRKEDLTRHVPFIFFSAKADKTDLPPEAQGKADSAWELLHLVTDRLERRFYAQSQIEHSESSAEFGSNPRHDLPRKVRVPNQQ